jgi:hypothetical protein
MGFELNHASSAMLARELDRELVQASKELKTIGSECRSGGIKPKLAGGIVDANKELLRSQRDRSAGCPGIV